MPNEITAGITLLKDENGNQILPRTLEKAVQDANKVTLDQKLSKLSEALTAKASPARTEYHTLMAAGWTAQEDGTSTQVITLTGTTIVGDPPVYVGETPTGMTAELLDAISAAKLLATAHTGTTVTVTAFGAPPEVDVPIYVTIAD